MHSADYCEIPAYGQRRTIVRAALVDSADYLLVAGYAWLVDNHGYVRRYERVDGAMRAVMLHRQIMGLSYGDGKVVDHINRDALDNRRANLRLVTPAGNMQNRTSHKNSSSRFRGVYWEQPTRKRFGRWRATVRLGNATHRLGRFPDEISAAIAADAFRLQHMPYAEPDPEIQAYFDEQREAA